MIIVGMTACGKTHYLLNMLEKEYKNHYDYIFIVCPTLGDNKTYQQWKYLTDPDVYELPVAHDSVENILRDITNYAKNTNSLIILDDCSASKDVKNRTSELVKLGFSGRHIGLSSYDRRHATTYLHCKTIQDEHLETRHVLQRVQRRHEIYFQQLPQYRKRRRKNNYRNVKK